jgi:DNA-binding NarL/FixJ family response regulator
MVFLRVLTDCEWLANEIYPNSFLFQFEARARGECPHVCAARILIADDHDVARQGLRAFIQEQPNWQIVAEVKDGRLAVAKAQQMKPDVAVLDIGMPLLNGLDATTQIAKSNPDTKVLILTMHDSDQLIQDVLRAGARGYVMKGDAGRDLVVAIRALLTGQTFFTQKVAQIVLDGFNGKRTITAETNPRRLTAKEREVVQLLAEGKSGKEAATVLNVSTKTLETHRSNIMRKLRCHSVTEVVRYAIRNHLTEA